MNHIVFVCMGNICRSPLAAVVAQQAFDRSGLSGHWRISSAGTIDHHRGEPADPRSIAVAATVGLDLRAHRATPFRRTDADRVDLIVAMDRRNVADLKRIAPADAWPRIRLLRAYAGDAEGEVPDPYYGQRADFEHCLALIQSGVDGLTKSLLALHNPPSNPLE